jgi:hypothetical protein
VKNVWHISDSWHDQHDQCHLWNRTLFIILSFCVYFQILWGSCCRNCSFLMWTIVCLLFSLFLTFVLWYVSLCLLSLKLSLYLVRILYVVVACNLTRLHQSNQAYSTTWQTLLICKYQIHSIFHVFTFKTWICLVNIPFYIQRFSVKCDLNWRFKPWWSTIPSISTKQIITSDLKITDYNTDQDT